MHVTNVTTSLDSRSVAQIIQNSSPILFFIKNRPAVWPTFFLLISIMKLNNWEWKYHKILNAIIVTFIYFYFHEGTQFCGVRVLKFYNCIIVIKFILEDLTPQIAKGLVGGFAFFVLCFFILFGSVIYYFRKHKVTYKVKDTELKTLEWWISRLMLKLLVLLNLRLF